MGYKFIEGVMKITVFCAFSFGTGDFSFGRKTAESLQKKYPDAEISLVTIPSTIKSPKQIEDMAKILPSFNQGSKFPVLYLNQYEDKMRTEGKDIKADLIVIGPVLNFDPDYVERLSGRNKDTSLFLMQEYDFDPDSALGLKTGLKDRGYASVTGIPTGINPSLRSQGMYVEASLVAFDKGSIPAKETVFRQELPITSNTILNGKSVSAYTDSTDTSVAYSHDNAERLIAVHAMMKAPTKNVDLIVMGEGKRINPRTREMETENHDRRELVKRTDYLLAKGFGSVVYQEPGKEPEILGKSDNGGPTYRIVHAGRVPPGESISLRKIGGSFGGATGDQSLSEAMSSSETLIYETDVHKKGIADGLEMIARDVDPSGKLERVVHLLTQANKEDEYKELAEYLKEPEVRDDLKKLQAAVLKKDLTTSMPETIAGIIESAQAKQIKPQPTIDKIMNTIKNSIKEVFSSSPPLPAPTVTPAPMKSVGTSHILKGLGVTNGAQLSTMQTKAAEQDAVKEKQKTSKGKEIVDTMPIQVRPKISEERASTPKRPGM
jgi:hypothetical protein